MYGEARSSWARLFYVLAVHLSGTSRVQDAQGDGATRGTSDEAQRALAAADKTEVGERSHQKRRGNRSVTLTGPFGGALA